MSLNAKGEPYLFTQSDLDQAVSEKTKELQDNYNLCHANLGEYVLMTCQLKKERDELKRQLALLKGCHTKQSFQEGEKERDDICELLNKVEDERDDLRRQLEEAQQKDK